MGFDVIKPSLKQYVHQKDYSIDYDDSITACIDMDLIAFKAATAGEKRFVIVTHTPTGSKKQFKNKSEFHGRDKKKSKGWLGELNSKRVLKGLEPFPLEDFTLEDDRKVDDISFILHTVKKMVDKILMSCKTSKYKAFLGSGENFRHKVATVQKYKEGRSDLIKPLYLDETRQYIIDKFKATLVEENEDKSNLEADDYLSIEATKGYQDYLKTKKCTVIQCSTDKDSYQTEGLFFNWDKMKKPFLVKGYGKLFLDNEGDVRGYGWCWLLFQMTVGDTADTYNPSKLAKSNFGEKGGYDLLKDTKTLKEGLEAVVSKFKEWYPEPVNYNHCTTGDSITKDWLGLANEYFTLAYMKRTLEDDLTFTKLLEENNIEANN